VKNLLFEKVKIEMTGRGEECFTRAENEEMETKGE
jgi:hypothetical protein